MSPERGRHSRLSHRPQPSVGIGTGCVRRERSKGTGLIPEHRRTLERIQTRARERELRLLEAIAAGDVQSLGELYDWYGGGAYRLALKNAADSKVAEHIVEDAFLTLWRTACRGVQLESVAAWLVAFLAESGAQARFVPVPPDRRI